MADEHRRTPPQGLSRGRWHPRRVKGRPKQPCGAFTRIDKCKLVDAFFEPFECLPFDSRAADVYGGVRADLERGGRPIGPNDLLIAATALAHDVILVTHDVSEFERVPGLGVEDWGR